MMDRLSCKPAFVNTWGDSFFAVFDELEDALKLALEARDYFNKGDWTDLLGGGSMEVVISMHAGPVYENLTLSLSEEISLVVRVNQAARIEPIVLPGSVFVSETVAALISFGYETTTSNTPVILNFAKILVHIYLYVAEEATQVKPMSPRSKLE